MERPSVLGEALQGAFVLSKTMAEPELVATHLRHYRDYLELLFDVA